jgi:clorobiocin biosynthesis protein CloN4
VTGPGLHRLVIDAAGADASRPALSGPAGDCSYGELDRAADDLARRLRLLDVRSGDRVLIWAEKSVETVAAMQAVLRLGAAYVPVDASTPAARVAVLAEDCAAAAVLGRAESLDAARAEFGAGVRCLSLEPIVDPPEPASERIDEPVAPDDLAYILYTSGSTGRPKGVCLSHRNALAFVTWAVQELGAHSGDRFSSHAPFTFDLSVLDLYAAFAVGACVDLIPAESAYAPEQLVDLLDQRKITVWYSVPSALTLMMRDGGLLQRPAPARLRAVLFAGEPFPINGVRALAGWTSARLLNLYGPTETNVCTFHEVVPDDLVRREPVPIGRPCSGDRAWAVLEDGTVAQPGDEGMLLVDGPTVMLGYWGQPPQRGPYATGDLVRVRADGSFDYLGRRDDLVKVRGHRIELGEIEAALAGHPAVAEAAATVVGSGIEGRLVAFAAARAGQDPGVLGLRRHLAELLPRYLIPDELRLVSKLPRNRNGKVDRTELAVQAERGGTP